MAEELLHRCAVLYKKRSCDCLVTGERLVLAPRDGASAEAEVFGLATVASFVPNKTRTDLAQQKVLLKVGFSDGSELVLDFQGSQTEQRALEKVLREHAGDRAKAKAETQAQTEAELARRRAKFLHERPAVRLVYESLVEKEKNLTPAEFWGKYDLEISCDLAAGPLRMQQLPQEREPQVPQPMVSGNFLSAERKRMVFGQFPEVEKLYKAAVPDLVTESDFWRRFAGCQFFWKSQGRQRETARDLLFDGLREIKDERARTTRLAVSPTVDLCADFLGEKEKFREEKLPNGEAFAALVTRFNKVGEKKFPIGKSAETVEQQAEQRLRDLEAELDGNFQQISDSPGNGEVETGVELSKLLASYVEEKFPGPEVWRQVGEALARGREEDEREGAANEVTMALSQSLRTPEDRTEKVDKIGRAMTSETHAALNAEFDLLAEQVLELLRHFWASADAAKRARIGAALLKKRMEIETLVGKWPPLWTASLKSLAAPIDWAEKVASKLGSCHCCVEHVFELERYILRRG